MVTAMNATLAHSRLSGDLLAQQVQLACVLEGHYAKFARGESEHPIHERFGELVPQLIRQAREAI